MRALGNRALSCLVALLWAPLAGAAVVGEITVRGEVGSTDSEAVELIQEGGVRIWIPRRRFRDPDAVRPGKVEEATLPPHEFFQAVETLPSRPSVRPRRPAR